MILNIWEEYQTFFIIVLGIIVVLNLAYLIFFKSWNFKTKSQVKKEKKSAEENKDNEGANTETEDVLTIDDFDSEHEDYVLGQNSNLLESLESIEFENKEEYFVDDDTDHKSIIDEDVNLEEMLDEDEQTEEEEEDTEEEVAEDYTDEVLLEQLNINHKNEYDVLLKIVKPRPEEDSILNPKFHVLPNKKDRTWYVKQEGEEDIDKVFLTQAEAIAFATIQALKEKTTIVVHDEEGKIIKYDF